MERCRELLGCPGHHRALPRAHGTRFALAACLRWTSHDDLPSRRSIPGQQWRRNNQLPRIIWCGILRREDVPRRPARQSRFVRGALEYWAETYVLGRKPRYGVSLIPTPAASATLCICRGDDRARGE